MHNCTAFARDGMHCCSLAAAWRSMQQQTLGPAHTQLCCLARISCRPAERLQMRGVVVGHWRRQAGGSRRGRAPPFPLTSLSASITSSMPAKLAAATSWACSTAAGASAPMLSELSATARSPLAFAEPACWLALATAAMVARDLHAAASSSRPTGCPQQRWRRRRRRRRRRQRQLLRQLWLRVAGGGGAGAESPELSDLLQLHTG